MPRLLLPDDPALLSTLEGGLLRREELEVSLLPPGSDPLETARERGADALFLDSEAAGASDLLDRALEDPGLAGLLILLAVPPGDPRLTSAPGRVLPIRKPVREDSMEQALASLALPLRSSPRVPYRASLRLEGPEGAIHATSRDLSLGGVFVHCDRPFEVGTAVRARLGAKGNDVVLPGTVVRVVAPGSHRMPGMAIRFEEPGPEERAALDRLLSEAPSPAHRHRIPETLA